MKTPYDTRWSTAVVAFDSLPSGKTPYKMGTRLDERTEQSCAKRSCLVKG